MPVPMSVNIPRGAAPAVWLSQSSQNLAVTPAQVLAALGDPSPAAVASRRPASAGPPPDPPAGAASTGRPPEPPLPPDPTLPPDPPVPMGAPPEPPVPTAPELPPDPPPAPPPPEPPVDPLRGATVGETHPSTPQRASKDGDDKQMERTRFREAPPAPEAATRNVDGLNISLFP